MQELITIPREDVRTVFTRENGNGVTPYLDKIREIIDDYPVLDMSNKKHRAEIKARVTSITKAKTYIETAGKQLAAEMKKEPKLVDASRKVSKDTLTAWAEEVRKPLDEWEAAEKERVDSIHQRINAIAESFKASEIDESSSHDLKEMIDSVVNTEIDESFEEFKDYAEQTKSTTLNQLYKWFDRAVKSEEEQAELEALRKAKAEQEEKDRIALAEKEAERIAAEAKEAESKRIKAAEEAVKLEAEAKAKAEKEKAEREALALKLQAEKAEKERLEAIESKRLSEERAEQARIKAEADHRQAIIDAEEEAKQAAINAKLAAEAETKKREANKAHCRKINNSALMGLMMINGVTEAIGKDIIKTIAKGEIDNITIKY